MPKGALNGLLFGSYIFDNHALHFRGYLLMQRLFKLVIGVLLLMTLGFILGYFQAHASAVLAQPFQPTSVNRMVSSSSLVTASTRFAGVTAANQSVYAVRAVDIGKASIANATRQRAFTPWGLGIVAAITAAGYIMENGEIKSGTLDGWVEGYYWGSSFYGHSMTPQQANQQHSDIFNQQNNRNSYPTGTTTLSPNQIRSTIFDPTTNNSFNTTYTLYPCSGISPVCPATAPAGSPISDDLVFDLFNTLSPSQQLDILNDPYTGWPDLQNIPEFQQAADALTSNWNSSNDGNPETVPEPHPTEQTSDEPFPEEETANNFCKSFPKSIACAEMGELPNQTDIINDERQIEFQEVNFSSSASCPASQQIANGVTFEYDAACTFATGVKPAVLAMAFLAGVYIMVGFKR